MKKTIVKSIGLFALTFALSEASAQTTKESLAKEPAIQQKIDQMKQVDPNFNQDAFLTQMLAERLASEALLKKEAEEKKNPAPATEVKEQPNLIPAKPTIKRSELNQMPAERRKVIIETGEYVIIED